MKELFVFLLVITLTVSATAQTTVNEESLSGESITENEIYATENSDGIKISIKTQNVGSREISSSASISVPDGTSVKPVGEDFSSGWDREQNKYLFKELMPGEREIAEAVLVPENLPDGSYSVEIVISLESDTVETPLEFNVEEGTFSNFETKRISKRLSASTEDNENIETEREKVKKENSDDSTDPEDQNTAKETKSNTGQNSMVEVISTDESFRQSPPSYSRPEVDYTEIGKSRESVAEESKRTDAKDETGQKGFMQMLVSFLNSIRDVSEGTAASLDVKEQGIDENFTVNGNFTEIKNLEVGGNSTYYTVSKGEYSYLVKDGEVVDTARSIDSLGLAEGKPFYVKFDSDNSEQKIIHGEKEIASYNLRKKEISDLMEINDSLVYSVTERKNEDERGLSSVYMNGKTVYSGVDNLVRVVETGGFPTIVYDNDRTGNASRYVLRKNKKLGPFKMVEDIETRGGQICLVEKRESSEATYCGTEMLSSQVETGKLHESGGDIYYRASKETENPHTKSIDRVMRNKKTLTEHPKVYELLITGERVNYVALEEDDSQALFSDGQKQKDFDAIGEITGVAGYPAVAVRKGDSWSVFHRGNFYGDFKDIDRIVDYKGKPAYSAETWNGSQVLVHGEKVMQEHKNKFIGEINSEDGELAYRLQDMASYRFKYNGKEGPLIPGYINPDGIEKHDIQGLNGDPVYKAYTQQSGPRKGVLIKGDTVIEKRNSIESISSDENLFYDSGNRLVWNDEFVSGKYADIQTGGDDNEPFLVNQEPVYVAESNSRFYEPSGKMIFSGRNRIHSDIIEGFVKDIDLYSGELSYLAGCYDGRCNGPDELRIQKDDGYSQKILSTSNSIRSWNSPVENMGELRRELEGDTFLRPSLIRMSAEGNKMAVYFRVNDQNASHFMTSSKVALLEKNGNDGIKADIMELGGFTENRNDNRDQTERGYWGIHDMQFVGGNLVFRAYSWNGSKVFSDGSLGNQKFNEIIQIKDIGDRAVYTAKRDDEQVLVSESGEIDAAKQLNTFKEIDGELAFVKNGETVVYNGNSRTHEEIGMITDVNGDLAYSYRESGEWKLKWRNTVVDEGEKIEHVTEYKEKPLYLKGSSIMLDGEKLDEVEGDRTEIITGEGFIGYSKLRRKLEKVEQVVTS